MPGVHDEQAIAGSGAVHVRLDYSSAQRVHPITGLRGNCDDRR